MISPAVQPHRLDKVENDARMALSRGVVPPTQVGVVTNQTGRTQQFEVTARTVNAGAVTLDTGYAPALGHASKLDAGYEVKDVANNLAKAGNGNASMKHLAVGAPVIVQLFSGNEGDGGLTTAVPSYGVSGAGTLTVTFTPPAGYAGNLDWLLVLNTTEN